MKNKSTLLFVIVTITMMFLMTAFSLTAGEMTGKNGQGNVAATQAMDSPLNASFFGKIPLYFIPNKGQVNDTAVFYAKASRYTLWVTRDGLVFDSHKKNEGNTFQRDVYRQTFLNANKAPEIVGLDKTRHRVSFYKGNDQSKWISNMRTDKAILYKSLYKNIDLKVYGIEKEVEYDWMVHPGGNPENIRFRFDNALKTSVDGEGNLVIKTSFGELSHKSPISFQVIDGKKVEVKSRFKKIGKNVYGFETGKYNKNHTLIIDPLVLVYSSYFGTDNIYELFNGFATDREGRFYLTGATSDNYFPEANNQNPTILYRKPGNNDAFVSVIDTTQSAGAGLIYSVYLSSNDSDSGKAIQVDQYGNIYVAGNTDDDSSPYFPLVNTNVTGSGGGYDVFVCKFEKDVDQEENIIYNFAYSTLVGGSSLDHARHIAIGNTGSIYVAGFTSSTDLPVTKTSQNDPWPAYRPDKMGTSDFFVARLNPGTDIDYCTYFGGNSEPFDEDNLDVIRIAIGTNDKVFIVGQTLAGGLSTSNHLKASVDSTNGDGFISILDTTLGTSGLIYSTYFGGDDSDIIRGIHVRPEDGKDAVYITGLTQSQPRTYTFPITSEDGFPISANPYSGTKAADGTNDAFVTKLHFDGSELEILYSSYLGGSGTEQGNSITVDDSRTVYVAGYTTSTDFPNTNAYQSTHPGGDAAFMSRLDTSRGPQGMIFSTYFGGSGTDNAYVVGYDNYGNVLIGGRTTTSQSASVPFPLSSSVTPKQSSLSGGEDAFVARLDMSEISNIELTSPIGGETWKLGESQTITWDYSYINDNTTVDILLMQNGSVIGTIADTITISNLSGSFTWTVGSCIESITVNPGDDYKVKIITTDQAYFDLSDTNFTINPSITVTSPNGGESLKVGNTYDITWNTQGVSLIKISLYDDNNTQVALIADGLDPATGSYTWAVGQYISGSPPATGTYKYTIKIKDKNSPFADKSDDYFAIGQLDVTSPNGAEFWQSGTLQNITWNAGEFDESMNMKITLYKGGVFLGLVGDSLDPASGSFSWTVGTYGSTKVPVGNDYKIKIKIKEAAFADESDADFTIFGVTVNSPNGGESWQIGTTQAITWNTVGITGVLKITLYKNGVFLGRIADNIDPSLGSVTWTVGNYEGGTAVPGSDYQIKIKEKDTSVADISDSYITLTN